MRSALLALLLASCSSIGDPSFSPTTGSGGTIGGKCPFCMSVKLGVALKSRAPVYCGESGSPDYLLVPKPVKVVLTDRQSQMVCGPQPFDYRTTCAASLAWKNEPKRNPRNGSLTACTFDNATDTLTYNARS